MLKIFLPILIAVLLFTAATAQNKSAAEFFKSGIDFKNNNQLPEALAEFNKAAALNKKFDSAYVEMGNMYILLKNTDYGISHYKKAIAINPGYAEALMAMGKIYRNVKPNLDSALFYFNAAAKVDTTNKEVFYNIAWTHNARKEYDKAIPYAIKALEIDNNYRPAYGELGHSYNASKKYAEAAEQFKKNLAISKVDIAMLYAGYANTELNNKEAALELYEELKKMNERMANNLKKKIDAMPVQN